MDISKHMFDKYGWNNFGTIVPTDKKSRADHDIHFSSFQMDQLMGCYEDGTMRQRSSSRLPQARRTIFSSKFGTERIRFNFLF